MIVSALTSVLIGALLAFRFRVLILIPVFGLAFIIAGVSAFLSQNAPSTLAVTLFTIITGLQIGYAVGIGGRHARLVMRATRIRSAGIADARVQRSMKRPSDARA